MATAQQGPQPLLDLTGVGKEFGAIRALHDVDMQVFPGEVVGLMGDNGAGKSTLVKIIAGNFRPSHGEVRFDGNAVHFTVRSMPGRSGSRSSIRTWRLRTI